MPEATAPAAEPAPVNGKRSARLSIVKKRFNAVLGHPAVTHVYTEFLVQ
jgi:hypothetical protein